MRWASALRVGGRRVPAVVAAGTDRGNEVLAHVGAITGLPMAANCVAVSAGSGGSFEIVRQRWAGLLLEEAVLDAPMALLTVATDAGTAAPADAPGAAVVHQVAAVTHRRRPRGARRRGVRRARAAPHWLARAWSSAAAAGSAAPTGSGRWTSSASLLGGVVGVSRVVTSEGWRPHTQQVGQTGTKITPDLYLACGISGAIQHIAGCAGAKHIIAINTDPAAPMMTRADYAVVGDLHEVIPALVKALRDRTSS